MTVVAQGYIGRNPADSSVIIARQTYRPTGVQTDFTFSSGYTVGYIDAYVNGVKLIEGDDFEAGNTSTVGLSSAAQSGDVVQLVAYKAFNIGNVTDATGGFTVGNDLTVNGTLFVGTAITANAGVISATQFVGDGSNLTGLANTDIISAQNFTLSGVGTFSSDIDVDGHTELDNLNVTGVATFSGPVSIAGTLSYEDVTNVDSVGLATFQAGIEIDDSITHLGDTNTKIRFPAVDTFTVETAGNERVRVTSGGSVGINTASPDRVLHVFSTNGTVAHFESSNANTISQIVFEGLGASAPPNLGATGEHLHFTTNNLERVRVTSGGDVGIGTVTPTDPVNSGNSAKLAVGIVTANEYFGDGSNLTGISVGLTTEDQNDSNAVITLDLTAAQDHRVVATGICTISVTNGSEADSHTVRIVNSGVSTVGFSTYFLFPSGTTPDLPTADGAISLISFTVHRVGVAGTQLLAGASLNFS
ncbi:hypothetical protein SynMITS9220M01_033 [Synechococcus phage SynMITS9220M01]|nr:hypothetical protein SynMITS9220M01_033 [Synechococcus phage SynMITS9220M01]